jgi:hypothetical protein
MTQLHTKTTHLQLNLLAPAQAQKHVTVNETFLRLDALVQLAVISRGETDPPAQPADGDRYIVASGGTGAWNDWDLNIATYVDGAWVKLVPRPGWQCWVADEGEHLVWTGDAWQRPADGLTGYVLRNTIWMTSSGTYEKPPWLAAVRVRVQGGGGGGGGAPATGAGEGSLGRPCHGGAYCEKWIEAGALMSSESVTVGAAGVGGTAGEAGTAGGDSAFGNHCSAQGSDGGGVLAASATPFTPTPGSQPQASGGDLNIAGQPHGIALRHPEIPFCGPGGGSPFGVGPRPRGSDGPGQSAPGPYGAGGGGGTNRQNQSAKTGGNGTPGIVVIEEYALVGAPA